MENLIEELTKVNPANLSEEGLKLFNKINEIIDRNEELEEIEIAHKEENGKLRERVRELEKEVVLVPEGTTFLAIPKEMIPKSKVREKIEEYEELVKDFEEYWSKDPRKFKRQKSIDYYKLEALKELLQEGDK